MIRLVFLFLCVALLAPPVWAAPAVTILPDKILTGHGTQEFLPRFTQFRPNSITVPAGETRILSGQVTHGAIEIAGTVRCQGVTLRVMEIVTLPGGTFDCPAGNVVQFYGMLDLARDPYQFGVGLINMGTLRLGAGFKTAYTELTAGVAAGATVIHLAVPADWEVGDELLFADMRQAVTSFWPDERRYPRREARVSIAAKTPASITLSKPLDYEHQPVLDPEDVVAYQPRVANLTRSMSVRSEHPLGARAHIIMLGHQAKWDVQGVGFYDLGRTRAIPLSSATVAGTAVTPGANQVGRYAFHIHHAHGLRNTFRGNALVSNEDSNVKWGVAIHNTIDVVIEESIAVGYVGAGFITEDGPERNNTLRRVVAAFSKGNGQGGKDALLANNPGAEGAGFWFRGMGNTLDGIESWNNIIGFQFMYKAQVVSEAFDVKQAVPIAFSGVAIGNVFSGLETWAAPNKLLGDGIDAVNNGMAVHTGSAEPGDLWVKNFRALCSDGRRRGVESASTYLTNLTIDGGSIRGCGTGVMDAGHTALKNVVLQNTINIDHYWQLVGGSHKWINVVHKPYKNAPKQYVVFFDVAEHPKRFLEWTPTFGARYRITNWQGTGTDYFLFHELQRASTPAPVADRGSGREQFAFEAGLTNGETWARWGVAYAGGVVADGAAENLEGLIRGVGSRVNSPQGPPRAVLGYPNRSSKTVVEKDGTVDAWFTPSGRSDGTNYQIRFRVDNGPVIRATPSESGIHKGSHSFIPASLITGHGHTITTWREDAAGAILPTSELVFPITGVDGTPPPPPSQTKR